MQILTKKSMPKHSFIIFLVALIFVFVLMLGVTTTALAAPTYADGQYDLPFQVLKDNADDISATSDYMVSPAKLTVADSNMHIEVTLNNSSWWQYFKVETASGTFVDVTTVSENVDDNTRVVQFALDDINALLHAKIHIIVTGIPGFEYDNTYDIRFKFDASGVPLAQEEDLGESEVPEQPTEPVELAQPEEPAQPEERTMPVESVDQTETETPAEDITSGGDEQNEDSELSEQVADGDESDEQADEQSEQNEQNEQTEPIIADGSSDREERDEAGGLNEEGLNEDELNENEQKKATSTSIILYIVIALVVLAVVYALIRKRKRD